MVFNETPVCSFKKIIAFYPKNYIKIRVNKLKVYNFDEGCNYEKELYQRRHLKYAIPSNTFHRRKKVVKGELFEQKLPNISK